MTDNVNSRSELEMGKVAYEAYSLSTEGKSLVSGDRLPEWSDLAMPIRVAWIAAARAVATTVLAERHG